jgi:hypothetical protein
MSEFDKVLEDIKKREIDMGIQLATMQADRDNIRADLKDCVNELCYQCGQYKTAHLGSCDDCRWKTVKEGLR